MINLTDEEEAQSEVLPAFYNVVRRAKHQFFNDKSEEIQNPDRPAGGLMTRGGNVNRIMVTYNFRVTHQRPAPHISVPMLTHLPRELRDLSISDYHVPKLPSDFGRIYRNLNVLKLRNTGLKKLPQSIGDLDELKEIEIEGNELNALPDTMVHMTGLKKMFASKNTAFTTLPEVVGLIPNLEYIRFDSCRISTIPKNIATLPHSLVRILIRYNNISPSGMPWQELASISTLEILMLSENPLGSIPRFHRDDPFPNLFELGVGNCGLIDLNGSGIFQMRALQNLVLSRNNFSELPEEIGNLSKLKLLNMRECPMLRRLPLALANLKSLRYLNIDRDERLLQRDSQSQRVLETLDSRPDVTINWRLTYPIT